MEFGIGCSNRQWFGLNQTAKLWLTTLTVKTVRSNSVQVRGFVNGSVRVFIGLTSFNLNGLKLRFKWFKKWKIKILNFKFESVIT